MPAGFFGDESFRPTPYGASQPYDVSGLAQAASRLQGAPARERTAYNPYQFGTPDLSAGSDDEWQRTFGDAMNRTLGAGARNINAQSAARMRGLFQGFGGHLLGGAAQKALMLQNAQQTGRDLAGMTSDVGGRLASEQAMEKMRTAQDVRNKLFSANLDRQSNQAAENYRAAGFSSNESDAIINDVLRKIQMFGQFGAQIPQLQAQLNQLERAGYTQDMQSLAPMLTPTVMG